MKFVWKGPPTAIEIFPTPMSSKGGVAAPLFSGVVATGREIPADLPEEHPEVRGWLAFGLIEPAPSAKKKEPVNG